MDDIQFSVVIPTYNRGHLLDRALESVLAQSKRPAEIVVIDDGSTDDTKALVSGWPDIVRYVYQENAGASAARNRGVQVSACEWIAFLDSDDYWQPRYLAEMASAIQQSGGRADLYFADTILAMDRGGERLWSVNGFGISEDYLLFEDAADFVTTYLPLPMMLQSAVFARQAFLDVGGFWEHLSSREDTHLFFKMGLRRRICAVNTVGAHMTSDDVLENRLTAVHQKKSPKGYWMQVYMYQNLLATQLHLPPAHRALFRRRLADAYLSLGRLAVKDRQWRNCTRFIAKSVWTDVRALRQTFFNKLG